MHLDVLEGELDPIAVAEKVTKEAAEMLGEVYGQWETDHQALSKLVTAWCPPWQAHASSPE